MDRANQIESSQQIRFLAQRVFHGRGGVAVPQRVEEMQGSNTHPSKRMTRWSVSSRKVKRNIFFGGWTGGITLNWLGN
jgi:hypothetical protein